MDHDTETVLEAGCDLRQRIYAAAEAAFMADGSHVATMADVARRAGCSKKTIYKLFASKEELFFGLLDRMRSEVEQMQIDPALPPEEALIAFLDECGTAILRPSAVAVQRLMMAEYTHSPGLLANAEGRSAGKARLALEGYFEALERAGAYRFGDSKQAARMLMGMVLGALHHEMLIGMIAEVPAEVLRERIVLAVGIFLRGTAV